MTRWVPVIGIPWRVVVTIVLMILGIFITKTTVQDRFIICLLYYKLPGFNVINSFGMKGFGVWPGGEY